MVRMRVIFLVSFYLLSCFSWRYSYQMRGSLYIVENSETQLFGYEEYQDADNDVKMAKFIQSNMEKISIQNKQDGYTMDKSSENCVEFKGKLEILFDEYLENKGKMIKDLEPRVIQGKECSCSGDESVHLEYCESKDSNPCYFSFPTKGTNVTFILTEFKPLDFNPFIPDLTHFCEGLGVQTVKEYKFPDQFHGQISIFRNNFQDTKNMGFSKNSKLLYIEHKDNRIYNYNMGIVLIMDPETSNLRIEGLKEADLKYVVTPGDTFEPELIFNKFGYTAPGYYIDLPQDIRRYTTKDEEYLRNFFTKKVDEKEVIYRISEYSLKQKTLSIYDVLLKEGIQLSQSVLENYDIESAYLENNGDKEIVFEFSVQGFLVPSSAEEKNIKRQISEHFDEYFKNVVNTNRLMARRIEIEFGRIYLYAKIANGNLFRHVFITRIGKATATPDSATQVQSIDDCELACNMSHCKMYYLDREAKTKNCKLYDRYLNKTEVDTTINDVVAIRVSHGAKLILTQYKNEIDKKLKSTPWKIDIQLLSGFAISLLSKSHTESFTADEIISMSYINEFVNVEIKQKSLTVQRDTKVNGKYFSQGRMSLKKCIDNFYNIRTYLKVDKFLYNTDFYECILVIDPKPDSIPFNSLDLYEYVPEQSFEITHLDLSSDGFIGQTGSLRDCAAICLENSTHFISIKTEEAQMAVPFERVCQGIQFDDANQKCYLLFKSVEDELTISITNESHKTFRRKIEDSFTPLTFFSTDNVENIGTLIPESSVPQSTCVEAMNLECSFLIMCSNGKEKLCFGNTAEMNITDVIGSNPGTSYNCIISQNTQIISNKIIKDIIVKEEKYRSLTGGGVAGMTIGLMIVGVILGVFAAKFAMTRI